MGRFGFPYFLIILSGIFMVQSMADQSEISKVRKMVHLATKLEKSIADPPVNNLADDQSTALKEGEGDHNEQTSAEAPAVTARKRSKHHSSDKSVAGGGVIIGGLVTAIFAAVFCYIRVTRKKSSDVEKH